MVPRTIVVALLIVLSSGVNSKPDKRTGILQVHKQWTKNVDVHVDIDVLDADDEFNEDQWLCSITTKEIPSKTANSETLKNNSKYKLSVSVSDDKFENDLDKIKTELERRKKQVDNNEDNSVRTTTFSSDFNATITPINQESPTSGFLITLVPMRHLKVKGIRWNQFTFSAFCSDWSDYSNTFYITGTNKIEIETKLLRYDKYYGQWLPIGGGSSHSITGPGISPMKVNEYIVYSPGFAILRLDVKPRSNKPGVSRHNHVR